MSKNDIEREPLPIEVEIKTREEKEHKYRQEFAEYEKHDAVYKVHLREQRRKGCLILGISSIVVFLLVIAGFGTFQLLEQRSSMLATEAVIAFRSTQTQSVFISATAQIQAITQVYNTALTQTQNSINTLTATSFTATSTATHTSTTTFTPTVTRTNTPMPTLTPTSIPRPTRIVPTLASQSTSTSYSTTGIVAANRLNVRVGPGPEYDEVTQLSNSNTVTIIGRNSDASWVQISGTGQRWVNASFIQVAGSVSRIPVTFAEFGDWESAQPNIGVMGRVTSTVRIRGGPGTNFRQLSDPDILEEGETVEIVGRNSDNEWYQINVGNRSAWITSDFVTIISGRNVVIPLSD